MKVVVRLAIVLATFLLVANMAPAAFAACDEEYCYAITSTDQNNIITTDTWDVCLNNTGTGSLYSFNADFSYSLFLFGGSPGTVNTAGVPALGGHPGWTTWVASGPTASGFLQPMPPGGGGLIISGEGQQGGTRYTIQGTRVSMSNCALPD